MTKGIFPSIQGGGAKVPPGFFVMNSLWFNGTSSFINYSVTSAGTRTKWTFATWLKRTKIGEVHALFDSYVNSSERSAIDITLGDQLEWENRQSTSIVGQVTSTPLHRDLTGWQHILAEYDSANSHIGFWVNGILQPFTTPNPIEPGQTSSFGLSGISYGIGRRSYGVNYFAGYMTQPTFWGGMAINSGELSITDVINFAPDGQIYPKTTTDLLTTVDTAESNSFLLDFSNTTSTTTVGFDASVHANNCVLANMTTANVNGDNPFSNFTTYNSLNALGADPPLFSEANRVAKTGVGSTSSPRSTIACPPTGKWYWECELVAKSSAGDQWMLGIISTQEPNIGRDYSVNGRNILYFADNGAIYKDGDWLLSTGITSTVGDIIGFSYDADAQSMEWFKNGVSITTQLVPSLSGEDAAISSGDADNGSTRDTGLFIGEDEWTYSAPVGYKSLQASNLPQPAIKAGADRFSPLTYIGDGTASHAITGLNFQPDFVWLKNRLQNGGQRIWEAQRGPGVSLATNNGNADSIDATALISFDNGGFTLGTASYNADGDSFIAWCFYSGGADVANNVGNVETTVRSSPVNGTSIIKWTGDATIGTRGHGLAAVPDIIIVKNRSATTDWRVYHSGTSASPEDDYIQLNGDDAYVNGTNVWNSTAPTSSVFSVGTDSTVNGSGDNITAFAFSSIPGFSRFGSYIGNGSTDGPFVYTGFKPAFVMFKGDGTPQGWFMHDNVRNPYNPADTRLLADAIAAESTDASYSVDFLATGFKLRGTTPSMNTDGQTTIYMAFAEFPTGGKNAYSAPAR